MITKITWISRIFSRALAQLNRVILKWLHHASAMKIALIDRPKLPFQKVNCSFSLRKNKCAKFPIYLWPSKLNIKSIINIFSLKDSFLNRRELAIEMKSLQVKIIKYLVLAQTFSFPLYFFHFLFTEMFFLVPQKQSNFFPFSLFSWQYQF